MSAHARLSASSAHRWMACPGSVAPGGKSSIYAATGTYAHTIGSRCLEENLDPHDFLLKQEVVDGFTITCDQEMVDVVESYLAEIRLDLQPGDISKAEMPLLKALSKVDKDMGGTADFVRYRPSDKSLRVVDFKYGSGTYVEADSNEQLKIYALGAMLSVGMPVSDVEVVIVQPRFEGAAPVRSSRFAAHSLLDFIADIQEAADRTRLPDPPLKAGDHCKFCPKTKTCPELLQKEHEVVAANFGEVVNYQQLADALANIPLVKERIKAIEELAYSEAVKGAEIPGYKLVDKVARRQWKSVGDVIDFAQAQAIDPFVPRELMSPAQFEKKLAEVAGRGKKKEAAAALEPLVEKVSSGTVLVRLDDNRPPAKRITAADFAAIETS